MFVRHFLLLTEKKQSILNVYLGIQELDELDRQYVFSKYLSRMIRNYIIDSRLKKRQLDTAFCSNAMLEQKEAEEEKDGILKNIGRDTIFKVYEANEEKYASPYYARKKTRDWAEANGFDLSFFL